MSRAFEVTTAITVYTTYLVNAANEGAARERVTNDETRANLASYDDGDNGDEEVISVRPAPLIDARPLRGATMFPRIEG